jgi:hypothetical protein
MPTLTLSRFLFFRWTVRQAPLTVNRVVACEDLARCKVVGEMNAACDSEYGVQMLMSVFPDQF